MSTGLWIFLGLLVIAFALYEGLGRIATARQDAAFAIKMSGELEQICERLSRLEGGRQGVSSTQRESA